MRKALVLATGLLLVGASLWPSTSSAGAGHTPAGGGGYVVVTTATPTDTVTFGLPSHRPAGTPTPQKS